MNPVVISVCIMLLLALMRVNVVVALTFSAIIGGLVAGMGLNDTVAAFESGLGGGATIALSYAMLGTFAVAISKSGITDLLANSVIKRIHGKENGAASTGLKYAVIVALVLVTMSSQNVIPVHIAFIPILIPPLLGVFAKLKPGPSNDRLCSNIWFGHTLYGTSGRIWWDLSKQHFAQKPS